MDVAVAAALEGFARDLLSLARAVRVYPSTHPYLSDTAERLTARVREELPAPLDLGVLPDELTLGSAVAGGKRSRAAYLAAQLHLRKVLRVLWTREATPADAMAFAELVAEPSLTGEDLKRALRDRKVHSIAVEPLDLTRLHEAFREGCAESVATTAEDARRLWERLLSQDATALDVAEALGRGAPWEGGAPTVARWLLDLGDKLRDALAAIPDDGRRVTEERLAGLGDAMSPSDMAEFLLVADSRGGLQGPLVAGVSRGLRGEKLVDVLAALASLEGRGTRRIADVFRRFAPAGGRDLLPIVRARLSAGAFGGFALNVWKSVESFLLDLEEDPFMGEEYANSLDRLPDQTVPAAQGSAGAELSEEPSAELDRVYLALAADDPPAWGQAFLDRLEARAEEAEEEAFLGFLALVEGTTPGLIGQRPRLVEKVFQRTCGRLRDLDAQGKEALLGFARSHERLLLETVLRALGQEERISVRRFLVEVVCAFSPAATPALVARVRSGPWFVTRNLAMALGRRGDPRTVAVLRGLLSHSHPKVRREAVHALARFEVPAARQVLSEFLRQGAPGAEERVLIRRTLGASAERGGV